MKKDPRQADDRLISGKLRDKAGPAGATHTIVTVDGTAYAWSFRHGWVVWGKGIKAVSISVSLHPGRTRELILDFTLKVNDADATPLVHPHVVDGDDVGMVEGAGGAGLLLEAAKLSRGSLRPGRRPGGRLRPPGAVTRS